MHLRHHALHIIILLNAGRDAAGQATRTPNPQHGGWILTVEARYGSRPGTELANPETIAVDGAGTLYVADARPAAVKVFDSDGKLLRTLGREGGGPGEYRRPWIAARGGLVVIHDPGQSRTTAYDTSGRYLRSWPTFCCHQNEVAIDRKGRIVIPAALQSPDAMASGRPRRAAYVRYAVDGRVIDTLRIRGDTTERLWTVSRRGADGKVGRGMTSVVVPYTSHQLFTWHPDGGFVSGWSAEMRLFRSSNGKDSTPLVSAPMARQRIPALLWQAAVDSAVAQLTTMVGPVAAREAVHPGDVPTDAPAFTRLLVDEEGNVWARQLLPAVTGATVFRVFGPSGADRGTATVPVVVPDWGGVAFGHGTMFIRTEDADGQPIIVRIRVRHGE